MFERSLNYAKKFQISSQANNLFLSFFLACAFVLFQSRYCLYYLFSHPSALTLRSLNGALYFTTSVIFALILALGFLSLGRAVLDSLKISEALEAPEKSFLSLIIGEGLMSLLILGFGLLSLYASTVLLSLFALLCWGTWRERGFVAKAVQTVKASFQEKRDWISLLCWAAIFAALLRGFIASSAPDADWDSLAYHLALPKIFLRDKAFVNLRWSANAHYPLNTEMIYLLCLALMGARAAHVVNFINGLGLLAATWLIAQRFFGKRAAEISCAILSVQPLFQRVIGNAETDLNIAQSIAAAFFVFLLSSTEPVKRKRKRLLFLCGLLSGLAASAKITGLWAIAALGAMILIQRYESIREKTGEIFLYGSGTFLLGFPWYLKNWLQTENPVWPYLGQFFHASAPDMAAWKRLSDSVTEGVSKTFVHYLSVPFLLILRPAKFLHHPQWMMVPFFILLFIRLIRRPPLEPHEKKTLLFIFFFYTVWFYVYQDWRYFLPAATILAVLIGAWSAQLLGEKSFLRTLAFSALLIGLWPLKKLSSNNEMYAFLNLDAASEPPAEHYLEKTLGPWYLMSQAANRLPPNSKIFLFRDVRGYYLNSPYAWGDPLNPGVLDYASITDWRQLRQELLALGFTHILYNPYIGNYQGDQAYYQRSNLLMAGLLNRLHPLRCLDGICLYNLY